MQIGVALSGGGIRGAAHIGVLKALEENNIKPKYISGASSGSIVAALYSLGYSPDEIKEIFLRTNKNLIDYDFGGMLTFFMGMLLNKKVNISGFVQGNRIERLIKYLASKKGIKSICSTKIPLAVSSVDINTSDIVMFTSYKLNDKNIIYNNQAKVSEAVRSSISFPFIFKPKILQNRRLVDGGVRENVPVKVLKDMGADKVIAVNLGYCGEHHKDIDNIMEISGQAIDIMAYSIFECKYGDKDIDYLIKPRIYDVKLLEFDKMQECIKRGYNHTYKIISDIKKRIKC